MIRLLTAPVSTWRPAVTFMFPDSGYLLLDGLVSMLVEHLKAGDRLQLNGLGVLEVKYRPARAGRNPATGETIQIAARKADAFKPAKDLKCAL